VSQKGRQLEPREIQAGKGTKGGLGGLWLKAAQDPDWWNSLSREMQNNVINLGRLEVTAGIKMKLPWPDTYFKTFPPKEAPWSYWDAREKAEAGGMELIVKERKKKKAGEKRSVNNFVLLGNDRHSMTLFLQQVLAACEAHAGSDAFQAVRLYLSQHPEMFSTDAISQANTGEEDTAEEPVMPEESEVQEADVMSEADWSPDEAEHFDASEPEDTVGSATVDPVDPTAEAGASAEQRPQEEVASQETEPAGTVPSPPAQEGAQEAETAARTPVPEEPFLRQRLGGARSKVQSMPPPPLDTQLEVKEVQQVLVKASAVQPPPAPPAPWQRPEPQPQLQTSAEQPQQAQRTQQTQQVQPTQPQPPPQLQQAQRAQATPQQPKYPPTHRQPPQQPPTCSEPSQQPQQTQQSQQLQPQPLQKTQQHKPERPQATQTPAATQLPPTPAAAMPKSSLEPVRMKAPSKIPGSFYKELEKSFIAAQKLDAAGQQISQIIEGLSQAWSRTGRVSTLHEGKWTPGQYICFCATVFRRRAAWLNSGHIC
jgi:hypothetical protein